MFVNESKLPHLLQPADYFSEQQFEAEKVLFLEGWHLIGTRDELRHSGDFLTSDLFGYPIQVRNFDGQLIAVSNVCAHRHCLMTNEKRGSSEKMQCQYHGWEYGADGRTRKIPMPKNFAPHDRDVHRLQQYQVQSCGQLVFVSLHENATDLSDQFGDLFDECAGRFGEGWECKLNWNPDYTVNWKVPVENTLEAYHVPYIHAETFRDDPGEDRSTHILNERRTAFGTQLPFSPHSRLDNYFQSWDGWLVRRLGDDSTDEYWQHHVFPNLLFSFTDSISLVHCVQPTGPSTSRGIVRQFSRVGTKPGFRRWFARRWAGLKSAITKKIMLEDLALFGDIQSGLQASNQAGVLGRCEERIHQFQKYLIETVGDFVDSDRNETIEGTDGVNGNINKSNSINSDKTTKSS